MEPSSGTLWHIEIVETYLFMLHGIKLPTQPFNIIIQSSVGQLEIIHVAREVIVLHQKIFILCQDIFKQRPAVLIRLAKRVESRCVSILYLLQLG